MDYLNITNNNILYNMITDFTTARIYIRRDGSAYINIPTGFIKEYKHGEKLVVMRKDKQLIFKPVNEAFDKTEAEEPK